MIRTLHLAPALALALGAVVSMTPAHVTSARAAGDGPSTTTVPTCRKGLMWDKRKKKCVASKKSSGLSDRNLYEVARDFAYRGRYADALEALSFVENENDARVLNYRGYATRKLGRVEEGLTYYRAALKADPNYTLVREYMGEAFLTLGRVDEAKRQLAEIGERCGTDCREYAMLDRAIAAHVSN